MITYEMALSKIGNVMAIGICWEYEKTNRLVQGV
jgi:hypothetical protein